MNTKGNVWLIVLLVVAIVVVALLLTRQGGDDSTTVEDGAVTEEVTDGTTPADTEVVGDNGAAAADAVTGTAEETAPSTE